jgi:hypothetical protein
MTRLVRTSEGVLVDPTGKRNGRGAYLHNQRSCWERALKGPLAQALKTSLADEDRASLENFMQTLPVETE